MKRKFSRILGVVAVIALLASFLVAPVAADVSEADVEVDPTTISEVGADYTIFFTVHEELAGEYSEGFTLPDIGDGFTITGAVGGDSGTITVNAGSVLATPANNATVDGLLVPKTITPADDAVAWTAPAAGDDIAVISTADHTTSSWTQTIGNAGTSKTEVNETVTATSPFSVPDVGDTFRITGAVLGADSGTITVNAGSLMATPAGGATIAGGTTAVPITSASGPVAWATTNVVTSTIDFASTADHTTGTYTALTLATAGLQTEVDEDVTQSGLAADGDTITLTFPADTVLTAGVPTATIAASKGWIGTIYDDATYASNAWSHNVDDRTLTWTMQAGDKIGAGAQIMINITAGITNPTDPGDYTLEVETSEEDDAVESATYEIEVPDVDVLPGVVEVYNPSDVLMYSTHYVNNALGEAEEGWTIKIGEGLYPESPTTIEADVTIEGSGDLEDIIIEGNWTINQDDITIDGLTLDGDLVVTADDFTIQNCVFDDGGTLDINAGGTDVTIENITFNVEDDVGIEVDEAGDDGTSITDCTFNIEEDGVGISVENGGTDTNVEDSTFTGDEGLGVGIEVLNALSVLSVEDSTFDGLLTAFDIDAGTVDIFGNTIQNCEDIAIDVDGATLVTIHNNTITGNDEAVILDVADTFADNVFMMFNTITDNAGDDDGLLIDNNDDDDLFVVNNWWGDADGPGDDAFSDDVESEPFLPGPITASAIDTTVATGTAADFEEAVGVIVESTDADMDIVGAAQYTENPAAAIDNAIGFWDIFAIDTAGGITQIDIRFYTTVTEDTEVWVWGAARGEWLEASNYIPNLFAGFVGVMVTDITTPTISDLEELPFVVVEPGAATADAVEITAPTIGAVDISVTPTLAWKAIEDATYEIQIAQDPTFAILDEAATSPTNAYIVTTALAEGQSYYWRVRAVTDAGAGDWATGVFTTATPEPEPTPPIEIVDQPPSEITVTMPPATITQAIDPGLLWAIVGVGAVLVISLIVLIVRTRRAV